MPTWGGSWRSGARRRRGGSAAGRPHRRALLVALLVAAACGTSGSAGSHALPEAFLGRWRATGTSGGLDGEGMGAAPSRGHVVIHRDRLETFDASGALESSVALVASRGATILSAEEQWLVRCGDGEPEVIRLSEDGRTLTLCENAYDGLVRHFERSP